MKQAFIYQNDSPIVMPGFYETHLFNSDTLYYINEEEKWDCEQDGREFVELDIDDFTEFRNDVCKTITDNLISPLLCEDAEICEKCEFSAVSSPRYYNYTNDKIELKLNIDLDKLKDKVKNDEHLCKCFDDYLKKHYDGFMSLVANNTKDFFEADDHLDVLIDFYLLTKIYECDDVVAAMESEDNYPQYWLDMGEIAEQTMWEHLVPIQEENE